MFCDFTMPTWRLQASGVEDSLALRIAGHPEQGSGAASHAAHGVINLCLAATLPAAR
jgi:hypothetical protein